MGIQLAIDDFGTGYASLSYVMDLPITIVKIDQSFVARIGRDPRGEAVVSAMIQLAHTLGLEVVAEGVETEGQLAFLCRRVRVTLARVISSVNRSPPPWWARPPTSSSRPCPPTPEQPRVCAPHPGSSVGIGPHDHGVSGAWTPDPATKPMSSRASRRYILGLRRCCSHRVERHRAICMLGSELTHDPLPHPTRPCSGPNAVPVRPDPSLTGTSYLSRSNAPLPLPVPRGGPLMDEPRDDPPPSLTQERQDLTRSRIREAAMKVVAMRGFDATVAEIAELSGVSPRTIFRHYARATTDSYAATVKDMYDTSGDNAPSPGCRRPNTDLDGWLEGLAAVIHTRSADIIGEAFWDLHASQPRCVGGARRSHAIRHEYRVGGIRYLTGLAWQTAGGEGEPPEKLVLVFGIHLSGFATHALMTDFDQTPQQIGALTAEILKMSLARALRQQRPPAPPGKDGS